MLKIEVYVKEESKKKIWIDTIWQDWQEDFLKTLRFDRFPSSASKFEILIN